MTARLLALCAPALYFALCVALIASVAPPLYWALHGAVSLRALVSRGSLLLVLLGAIALGRRLQLTRTEWAWPNGDRLRGWLSGLGLGVLIMSALFGAQLALGIRAPTWADGSLFSTWLHLTPRPLLVGCAVGALEEWLFRGVLLGVLLRELPVRSAVLTSALYYAAVHFFHSTLKIPADQVNWLSGWQIAADAWQHLWRFDNLDSFAALLAAGVFLGTLRQYSRYGLIACMGVHAGWVYVLRVAKQLSDPVGTSIWIGHYDATIGWLAALWLGALAVPLWYQLGKR